MKYSNALAAAMLAAVKAELDGGYLYIFAGTVPDDASDALDMVTDHTQVVRISVDGDAVGITFDAPTANVLSKAAAEVWSGLIAFDGTTAGPGTLTPTFWRLCAAGDDGRGAAGSNARLQGTIGGPASSADIRLGDGTTMTDNGANTRSLPIFTVTLPET